MTTVLAVVLALVAVIVLATLGAGVLGRYRREKGEKVAPSPVTLARLRAAPLPADLATLAQGPPVAAIKRIRETSGLGLKDSKAVYEYARAGLL